VSDSPIAAPAPLERVRGFVNTLDVEDGVDTLATVEDLRSWLGSQAVPGDTRPLQLKDLERTKALRESLRVALRANHDRSPVPPETALILEQTAARAKVRLSFSQGRATLVTEARGLDAALAELAIVVADATLDGSWSRLKVCQNDACQWAFYDRSNARASKWCYMSVCGNRAKQRTHRARATGPQK
jgi:predicted RNA-binding Zn ribbon-like protein